MGGECVRVCGGAGGGAGEGETGGVLGGCERGVIWGEEVESLGGGSCVHCVSEEDEGRAGVE